MKHLLKFENFSRQNYYHFTSFEALLSILSSNTLGESGDNPPICLTRDKNLHKHTDYLPKVVRLELDGDLLSQNYKIKPYMDSNLQNKYDGSYIGRSWKGNPHIDYDFVEFEERLYSDKIFPLNKYLVSVSIKEGYTDIDDDIIKDYINKFNIEFKKLL